MKISKKFLGSLEKDYATAIIEINEETSYLVASEGQGSCLSFSENNASANTLWDKPGGTMNIVHGETAHYGQ